MKLTATREALQFAREDLMLLGDSAVMVDVRAQLTDEGRWHRLVPLNAGAT